MNVLAFSGITPAHWDAMTGQAAQDRYRTKMWRARVWMNQNQQRLEIAAMLRQTEEMQRCALFRRQAI